MSTLKVGTIQDHANSNTAISIDSSGRVTHPATPRFEAGFSNDDMSNVGTTNGTDYVFAFTQTIVNVGSHWNGTNTFTAPVNGLYFFYSTLYTNYTSNYARFSTNLIVNNTKVKQTYGTGHDTETSAHHGFPVFLNANDTVKCGGTGYDNNATGNTWQIYRNTIFTNFGGYLIG